MSLQEISSTEIKLANAQNFVVQTIKAWFIIASLGLLLFSYYMIRHYLGNAASGNLESWAESSLKGYQSDDPVGNIFFALHIILAIIISMGGFIQFIPFLRKNHVKIHRYNGMLFIITAILISLGGLYLTWIRGASTTFVGAIAITINALLIMFTAIKTWNAAKSKKFGAHRKWAMRVFLLANGVWFFRIGFMAWILINQGQKWSTNNLDGPFDYFWAFANYLIPLAILEVYFKIAEANNIRAKRTFAFSMIILCLLTVGGILATYFFMWQPIIASVTR